MRKNEKHVILCLLEVARRGAKFGTYFSFSTFFYWTNHYGFVNFSATEPFDFLLELLQEC